MESTSIATSSMKALNFLRPPPNPQTPTKPKLTITSLHIPKKTIQLSLTRCSTKPHHTNIGDQDPTFNVDSDPQRPESPESHELSSFSPPPPQSSSSSSSSSSHGGLVFDSGVRNSWDGSEIGSPVVKRFLSDDEERWYMWYHGRSSDSDSDSVGLAVSGNGVHWERGAGPVQTGRDVGSVMGRGSDWWAFDTLGVRPGEVVVMSSSKVRASTAVYWMYYAGFTSDEASNAKIKKSLPGLAISQDGRYWARIEGDHHSGALFDVGPETEWDSLFVASPKVVFHGNGDLRMYYHSFHVETGRFCVGVARSRDGIRWVKLGRVGFGGQSGNFDELGALNPHVVRSGRRDGGYLMAYEGVGPNGERSVGLAESRDGLKDWARVSGEAVLEAQEGWDHKGVGSPCLVQMDGEEDEWRLYYCGVGSEGRTGIGLAISHGSDVTRFRRWSGFHL